MDATTMDADAFKQPQSTQHPFPEHLPPRKFTQTWMQRNGFKAKTFFTLYARPPTGRQDTAQQDNH